MDTKQLTKRRLDDVFGLLDDAYSSNSTQRPNKRTLRPEQQISTPRLMRFLRKSKKNLAASQIPAGDGLSSQNTHLADPTSLPGFLHRLSTYKLTTYSIDKPRSIDSVAAARHGWTNQGDDAKERLFCESCKAAFRVPPPSGPGSWRSEAGKKLAQTYAEYLVSKHAPTCLWRARQSPPCLYKLPPLTASVLLSKFVQQAMEFQNAGLEHMHVRIPSYPYDGTRLLNMLRPLFTKEIVKIMKRKNIDNESIQSTSSFGQLPSPISSAEYQFSNSAILLAILGWQITSFLSDGKDKKDVVLSCSMCLRRVGVWSFLDPSLDSPSGSSTPNHLAKSVSTGSLATLNRRSSSTNIRGNESFASLSHANRPLVKKPSAVSFSFGHGSSSRPAWLADETSNADESAVMIEETSHAPLKNPNVKEFDPVSYHARTCPFVDTVDLSSNVSSDEKRLPAWASRVDQILNKYGCRTDQADLTTKFGSNQEILNHVRKILGPRRKSINKR